MTTKAVGNRRLLKLAAFLDTLPKKDFNMKSWLRDNKAHYEKDRLTSLRSSEVTVKTRSADATVVAPRADCGFAACAVGWACSDKSFRRAGLRLELSDHDWGYAQPTYYNASTGVRNTGYEAIQTFFAMDDDGLWSNGSQSADRLFGPSSYRSGVAPTEVAARIRKYVAEGYKAIAKRDR